ncbi:MAG: hypothetical protein FJ265_09760 [Planctomycetes bacterium]|nr:hypothetical protein [Planctomycetota bacterium]
MRADLLQLACVALSFVPALPSQNVTVPALLHGVEGGGSSNVPFGSSLACVYQCIYDAAELPWTGPRQIDGISLRADNGTPTAAGTAIAAKGYLDVSVKVSTTHRTSASASSVFEDNYGEDVTTVLSAVRMQLPAQPLVGVGPRPANVDLMFSSPWWYGLTPARGNQPPPGNLLVEIWVHAQPSGAYRLDGFGSCTAAASDFGNQGPGCAVPGVAGGPPVLESSPSMLAGSSFTWTVRNGPPNAPFLVAANLTNQGSLLGQTSLSLPFPLYDPANPNLPPPGVPMLRWPAPDCWLNIDPVATLFGLCDPAGTGVATVVLPAGRHLVGDTLFGQAILLVPTANPLQIVTTRGRQSTICGPLGVARIYAFYNSTATPPTSGAVQYGLGLVFEVR